MSALAPHHGGEIAGIDREETITSLPPCTAPIPSKPNHVTEAYKNDEKL